MHVCMYVSFYVCMYVCMYVRTYIRMYVLHTYVCTRQPSPITTTTYVRTHVCMYVCMLEENLMPADTGLAINRVWVIDQIPLIQHQFMFNTGAHNNAPTGFNHKI